MTRSVLTALAAALVILAPPSAFASFNESGGSHPCPADMMCTMDAPADNSSSETDAKPHVDCPAGDTCVDKAPGGIGPADNASSNCMDGQQQGETCDPHVYYMTGGDKVIAGKPTPDAPADATASEGEHARRLPALGIFAVLAVCAVGVAVLVARIRK